MNEFEEFYKQIVSNKLNYGTGSWSVIDPNIKTVMNEYGEYYPNLENLMGLPIDEQKFDEIKKVTLLSDESPDENDISNKLYSNNQNIKYDERVGFYLDAYVGYVAEGSYREKASSGGFATWIFKELLEKDLIDGVIHVKENKNIDSDIMFKYDVSLNIEELCEGSKTKYYPVEFSEALKYVKDNPGKYAFIGVPSFVMSLRLLQEQDPILKERIIYTLGLICGHQKSSKYTEAIAWQCGIKPGNLLHINYRKKIKGVPPYNYTAELVGVVNGEKVTITKNMTELQGTNWGQGFFKINASDYTDDVMNETADVTLGDAWLPEYTNNSEGYNVILTRNRIIDDIIKEGKNNNKIHINNMTIDDICKSQDAHFRHTRDELPYRLYLKKQNNEWYPNKRIDVNNKISQLRAKVQDSRKEISAKSHLIYKDAVEQENLDYFQTNMNKYVKRYRKIYSIITFKEIGIEAFTRKLVTKVIKKGSSFIK